MGATHAHGAMCPKTNVASELPCWFLQGGVWGGDTGMVNGGWPLEAPAVTVAAVALYAEGERMAGRIIP